MATINENQLNQALGKNGTFAPRTSLQCTHYLGGFDAFDSVIDRNSFLAVNMPTNIHLRPSGIEFSVMCKFTLYKLGLHYNDVLSVHIESKEVIKETKEKSVLGRALIGGLIFGPVGAIVGAITGIGTKEVVIFEPDYMMIVTYKDSETNKAAIFSCDADKKSKLFTDARAVFGSKLTL